MFAADRHLAWCLQMGTLQGDLQRTQQAREAAEQRAAAAEGAARAAQQELAALRATLGEVTHLQSARHGNGRAADGISSAADAHSHQPWLEAGLAAGDIAAATSARQGIQQQSVLADRQAQHAQQQQQQYQQQDTASAGFKRKAVEMVPGPAGAAKTPRLVAGQCGAGNDASPNMSSHSSSPGITDVAQKA